MKWLKGCLAAALVVLLLLVIGAVVVGPGLVRRGEHLARPILKMHRSGESLEDFVEKNPWSRPEKEVVAPEQLDRFLQARRGLDELYRRMAPRIEEFPRGDAKSFGEVVSALDTMGELVPGQLDVFVASRITPREYRWVERIVYGKWRSALGDPGIHDLAARVIEAAAESEPDAAVAARLNGIAQDLRRREPAPPRGFDEPTHELLLSRREEIDLYSLDAFRDIPIPTP